MRQRVLVTGGAGFIGSHVAEAYVNAGARVWIVDNLSSGKLHNVPAGAELVHMDVRDARLRDVFRDIGGFDIVNHHAAQIDVRTSVNDPRLDAAINVDGFLNVAECALAEGCGRFVFVSSGGVVYGEPELRPSHELLPKLPRSPYGVTKLAAEQYLYYYANIRGLEYAAVRYSNVYGPRQDPHGEAGVVAIFSTRIGKRTPLTIFGTGEQTRDYVFVGDVVAANLKVGSAELARPDTLDARAFNVGTGIETDVNELARTLMRAAGCEVEMQYAPERPGELLHSCLDASKLRGLGWAPAVTLQEGLAITYEYINNREAAA
jgi:UDP-glucose 4-epimerase